MVKAGSVRRKISAQLAHSSSKSRAELHRLGLRLGLGLGLGLALQLALEQLGTRLEVRLCLPRRLCRLRLSAARVP